MKTPCILWHKSLDSRGHYGRAIVNGRETTAHRAAYCKARGVSLDSIKGLDVCHECDTMACVNPEHLFLGTRKQNMQDAKRKGRTSSGTKHRAALRRRDFKYDAEHARRTSEGKARSKVA